MNPTSNTSGNPYGLSNAPIASTPLEPTTPPAAAVPPRRVLDSVKPVTVPVPSAPPMTPVAPTPVTPAVEPTPAPLPPAPTLPIEQANPDVSVPPAPVGPPEPGLSPVELTVAQLEVEPDTSPTGASTTSTAFGAAPAPTFMPPAPEPVASPAMPEPPAPEPVALSAAPAQPAFFGDAKTNKRKGLAAFKIDFKNFRLSKMGWIIIGGIVALLAIGALVYFFLLPLLNQPKTTDTTKNTDTSKNQTPTETSATVNQSVIDDVTNVYGSAVKDEASTAGTDDTGYVTDASNSAANVGNSVNEANF